MEIMKFRQLFRVLFFWGGIINPLTGLLGSIDQVVHQFVVNNETFIGHLQSGISNDLNSIVASTSATSTIVALKSCNPLAFDTVLCISALFTPDSVQLQKDFKWLYDGALTHFPIGYLTDFISILATSTGSSSIPVLRATVPNGVVGAGSSITLDLNHSLDYILYSTAAPFGTSTETFL